jgi:hypothetical protein
MDLAHGSSTTADDGTAGGSPAPSAQEAAARGRFAYDIGTDTWWWSEGTYRIHGFEPGEVVPTMRLVLAHKHPDDRERFRGILLAACRTGEPFVSVHRIMAATGETRNVVLVGRGEVDVRGEVRRLTGSFVDVTALVTDAAAKLAGEQIRSASESRATIEQAKGILGAAWKVSPEAAFERLRRASMRRNIPVRELAADVVRRACGEADA